MNKIKKLLASLTALIMAVGLIVGGSVPVMAATPHSITIINTNNHISINGKTYTAYKLFDSTQNSNKTAYAYTLSTSSPFYSADLTTALAAGTTPSNLSDVLRTYFTFTAPSGDSTKLNVTAKGTFDASAVRAFADAIQPYLSSVDTTIGESTTYKKTATASEETATINLDNDDAGLGYYIVTGNASPKDPKDSETVESAVMVTNEDPSPAVNPKADIPSIDKKITGVAEGSNEASTDNIIDKDSTKNNEGTTATASIGDKVSFKLTSNVPDLTGYTDYTFEFHDTLSKGLTTPTADSIVVKIGNNTLTHYTDDVNAGAGKVKVTVSGQNITIKIPFAALQKTTANADITKGTAITAEYSAVVNQNALTTNFETNTAKVTYSNDPYSNTTSDTPDKKTYVVDIDINVDKVDATKNATKVPDAKFKLYRTENSTNQYYKYDSTNNKVTWITESDENKGDEFITGSDGKLYTIDSTTGKASRTAATFKGLDQGTFYLIETEAPDGYNKLANAVKVDITASKSASTVTYNFKVNDGTTAQSATNGTITLSTTQENSQPVASPEIHNNKGSVLPSTGGIGTTIFYVAGGAIVIVAAVLLINRMKSNA